MKQIKEIINEDGTILGPESGYPKHPLIEKWEKLYPPTRFGKSCSPFYKSNNETIFANYGCILCHEMCPYSDNWKVPEEDREVWDEYQRQISEYHKIHNQSLAITVEEYLEKYGEEL